MYRIPKNSQSRECIHCKRRYRTYNGVTSHLRETHEIKQIRKGREWQHSEQPPTPSLKRKKKGKPKHTPLKKAPAYQVKFLQIPMVLKIPLFVGSVEIEPME